jgi:xanthine dehydrogenase YagS FAD-binding subunit
MAKLAESDVVQKHALALSQAAAGAATPQIRNMATVGGNLLQRPRCWYFRSEAFHCRRKGGPQCFAIDDGENQYHAIFDNKKCAIVHPSGAAIPLVALGAEIELTGPQGKRRVKLEDFFVTPEEDILRENRREDQEILTEIRVPKLPDSARSWYIKQGEKESFDWPIADVAVVIDRDGDKCKSASIVLGAAAPTPHRAAEAEKSLVGQPVTEQTARKAAKAALAAAQPLSQNGYKLPVFEAVIARTFLAAVKA